MDLDYLSELDAISFIVAVVVTLIAWFSIFQADITGWSSMGLGYKIVMLISSFVVTYFVSVAIINK